MTALELLKDYPFKFQGRVAKPSASELKTWAGDRILILNGTPIGWDEEVDFTISSV